MIDLAKSGGNLNFNIRTAEDRDQWVLSEVFLLTRRQAFYWIDPLEFKKSDFNTQTEGEDIYVTETPEGVVVGFISVWEPERFVHHLFIHPDYQGRGLGKGLLSHISKLYGLPLRLKCMSQNKAALAFYRKQNWIETGKGQNENGEYINLALQ